MSVTLRKTHLLRLTIHVLPGSARPLGRLIQNLHGNWTLCFSLISHRCGRGGLTGSKAWKFYLLWQELVWITFVHISLTRTSDVSVLNWKGARKCVCDFGEDKIFGTRHWPCLHWHPGCHNVGTKMQVPQAKVKHLKIETENLRTDDFSPIEYPILISQKQSENLIKWEKNHFTYRNDISICCFHFECELQLPDKICSSFFLPPSLLPFFWRITWTEEPGGLQSMRSQRVRHNWVTNTFIFSFFLFPWCGFNRAF